ncbi:MAG TPA: LLM class flavin-dependent oxidoreductase, partial [Gaiellaceae bacterium]
MEIGVYTFAELRSDPRSGRTISAEQRLRDLLEEAQLADQVGLDVFGVGEHHRTDFAVSAPAVVLAAVAERTRRIRLTSAVSVISSDDPVRVFEEFATLDLLSGGRAEIMAGRGSFVESFPLFGYDLRDYDELFAEKLELLLRLRDAERVTWSGKHRAPLDDLGVYPRPLQDTLPVWVAVGGNPESAARAGTLGLPMALAIIGGQPERFLPLAELHREAARGAGHDPVPALSINSHAYVADTSERAAEEFFPSYSAMMNAIGRERGWRPIARPD